MSFLLKTAAQSWLEVCQKGSLSCEWSVDFWVELTFNHHPLYALIFSQWFYRKTTKSRSPLVWNIFLLKTVTDLISLHWKSSKCHFKVNFVSTLFPSSVVFFKENEGSHGSTGKKCQKLFILTFTRHDSKFMWAKWHLKLLCHFMKSVNKVSCENVLTKASAF